MKVIFWLSTVVMIFSVYIFLQGYINVYHKNYNGGPESSSGSVKYWLWGSIGILLTGSILYIANMTGLATLVMALPVACAIAFVFCRMILPILLGGKMQ